MKKPKTYTKQELKIIKSFLENYDLGAGFISYQGKIYTIAKKTLKDLEDKKMTELKTLKDILPKNKLLSGDDKLDDILIWSINNDLKAEAVKWVKLIKDDKNKINFIWDAEGWIKHFFNLTEKDLIPDPPDMYIPPSEEPGEEDRK